MRSLCPVAVLLACWLLPGVAAGQQRGAFKKTIAGFDEPVLAFVPADYSAERSYGLVLCLHGTGMKGRHMVRACPVKELNDAGYLLVCPSSPQGAWGTAGSGGTKADLAREIELLRVLLEAFLGDYQVDPRCVHTIGFSAGTVVLALAVGYRPEWDALKVRSVCGHSGGLGGGVKPAKQSRTKETAVWIVNGSLDGAHARVSHNVYEGFKQGGYTARYTEVPGLDHAYWLVPFRAILGWWCELDGEILDAGRPSREQLRTRARAWFHLADGEHEQALPLYEALLESDPKDQTLHHELACTRSALGDGKAALESLERAVELGFRYLARIELEPTLEGVRKEPGYAAKIRELQGRGLLSGGPYLGVTPGRSGSRGFVVGTIRPGSPASRSGLKPGDRILEVDGERVRKASDLSQLLQEKRAGDEVELQVKRGQEQLTLRATLGRKP